MSLDFTVLIICGIIIYFLSELGVYNLNKSSLVIGATISFGVLGACMTATTLGAFSPFLFAKFRIDPAVASGPIVTAFNDVLSTLVFFLVARGVNHFLG